MLSLEALTLFSQLLQGVRLDAADSDLEVKAALIVRVRTELVEALKEVSKVDETLVD